MKNKIHKTEGSLAIIAALIVLFSAMWEPFVSIAVAIIALVAFAIWEFSKK